MNIVDFWRFPLKSLVEITIASEGGSLGDVSD
jgi:hypothetical protein